MKLAMAQADQNSCFTKSSVLEQVTLVIGADMDTCRSSRSLLIQSLIFEAELFISHPQVLRSYFL